MRYAYHARTQVGKAEDGTVEAPNLDEAVHTLHGRDLVVVKLREHGISGAVAPAQKVPKRGHRGVKPADLVIFARSMAAMTEAGLPLLRALETVGTQIRSQRLQTILKEICQDIRGGSTFRDALAKHPGVFSPFWVSLVETGEASGQLTKTLEQIGIHIEKAGAIQRKVVSALFYPGILLTVAAAAILIFTLFIIPTFAKMFAGFGAKLPFLTQMVMAFSDLLRRYFFIGVAAAIGLFFLLKKYLQTPVGRWQFDTLRLRIPLLGPVFQGAVAEQFTSNLGMLLRAGVPILHALEIVITTCDNKVAAAVIENMKTGVREGKPLAEPLAQSDLFPPMVAQMLAVGEQTGKLPDMLQEVGRYYEEQVTTAVERLTALIEPIMLVGMGLIIGTLVIAMYLPVFQLTSVMKG